MDFERNQVLTSANACTRLVDNAHTYCEDAKRAIEKAKMTLINTWRSDSGDAMVQALDALSASLNFASIQLSSVSPQMTNRAWSVYNSWPEEKEPD